MWRIEWNGMLHISVRIVRAGEAAGSKSLREHNKKSGVCEPLTKKDPDTSVAFDEYGLKSPSSMPLVVSWCVDVLLLWLHMPVPHRAIQDLWQGGEGGGRLLAEAEHLGKDGARGYIEQRVDSHQAGAAALCDEARVQDDVLEEFRREGAGEIEGEG